MADKRNVLLNDGDSVNYETSPGVDVYGSFDSIGLRQDLMRGIYAYGMSIFINYYRK